MKKYLFLSTLLSFGITFGQTCNKLNHNCSNTVNLNTSGVTANAGSTNACALGDYVLNTTGSNPYIATNDISIDQGSAATLHFDAKRASSYSGTCEVWVHVGGYCSFQVYTSPFNTNGWVQIGTFNPLTTCSSFGPFTVPSAIIGGQDVSFCIVPKNASSSNWVSIDNICVSQVAGTAVPTSWTEDFGTSSSGWYPSAGYVEIPYHTYKNASDAYVLLSTGVDGFPDKAAYFYTGFDFCSTVSGTGIVTREVNTSGYANGEIRVEFKSKYPCSGTNSYTFDENYQSYSPEIFVMTGPDNGSNTWVQLPVNYYFADYNWRVASYDISAYKNANVRFKIERGGFCSTAMEAIDDIKIFDRDCSISLLSCGTITGQTAPLQNIDYAYSVPAVTGATYYKWYVRHDGNLYDTSPYIVSGQGTQNVTINFQSLPTTGVRVLCIPFDANPAIQPDACYAEIGILGVTVAASNPPIVDSVLTINPTCFGDCNGIAAIYVSGGQAPYAYSWSPNVSSTDSATGLCAGSYDVTVTDQNGLMVSTNLTLTEPSSLIVACQPNDTICPGDTLQLSGGAVTGGTPGYSYFWSQSFGNNISDPNVSDPFVFPNGTVTYTLEITDIMGCVASCTFDVIVHPNPSIVYVISPNSGCTPDSVQFTPILSNAATCFWDFDDGASDTSCSQLYHTYLLGGNYTPSLTVTSPDGCIETLVSSANIVVNDSPVVDAGADTSVCDGDNVILTAFNPDSGALSWNNGVIDGQSFVPTVSGYYTVQTIDTAGCTGMDSLLLTISPIPTVDLGPDTLFCGNFYTIDAGPGFDSYDWSTGETTQSINVVNADDYSVTVSINGCESSDTVYVQRINCAGIMELAGWSVKVYPNPAQQTLFLEDLPFNTTIRIIAMDGREALTTQVTEKNASVSVEELSPGTYLLMLSAEGDSQTIRFIKE